MTVGVTDPSRAERTAALVVAYRATGERRLRNEIVELHLDVAEHYIRRYGRRGTPVEDLRQVALLTIVRAVDRFDPDQGVAFSTFASRTVDGELKRYFRDRTWLVRPPRRAQELHLSLRRAEDELTQHLGRSPSVDELAAALGVSTDDVLQAVEAAGARGRTSLDHPVVTGDGEATALADRLLGDLDPAYAAVDRRLVVRDLLRTLDARERRIIEMRFFEGRTQEEIAEQVGVSQSYLSRLLRQVLLDLRARIDGSGGVLA